MSQGAAKCGAYSTKLSLISWVCSFDLAREVGAPILLIYLFILLKFDSRNKQSSTALLGMVKSPNKQPGGMSLNLDPFCREMVTQGLQAGSPRGEKPSPVP